VIDAEPQRLRSGQRAEVSGLGRGREHLRPELRQRAHHAPRALAIELRADVVEEEQRDLPPATRGDELGELQREDDRTGLSARSKVASGLIVVCDREVVDLGTDQDLAPPELFRAGPCDPLPERSRPRPRVVSDCRRPVREAQPAETAGYRLVDVDGVRLDLAQDREPTLDQR
jgi:hypothetical protein